LLKSLSRWFEAEVQIGLMLFGLGACWAAPEERRVLALGDSRVEVVVEAGDLDVSRDVLFRWIEDQSRAVGVYFGGFPVEQARIRITPSTGRGTRGGVMYPGPEPLVVLQVGADCTETTLRKSWVLTHELTHLALSDQRAQHQWLEEGMATYVEPWIRVKQGQIPHTQVWRELVVGLPQGLPGPGDQGLDKTHTWGRTYWGGALFFFLADLEIRHRSNQEKGIRDALMGITSAGLNATTSVPIEEVLAVGDAAVGYPVLTELYSTMRADPHPVDLDALWTELGVEVLRGEVHFNDAGSRSATRRAMSSL
jgi:hypothetical protein